MTKNFLERCRVFDISSESYDEFIDENDKPELDKSKIEADANCEKVENNIQMQAVNQDRISKPNHESNFEKNGEKVAKD